MSNMADVIFYRYLVAAFVKVYRVRNHLKNYRAANGDDSFNWLYDDLDEAVLDMRKQIGLVNSPDLWAEVKRQVGEKCVTADT